MILFHGTDIKSANNILDEGIRIEEGNDATDFGQGFYTTQDRGFAIKCAIRASKRTDLPPALISFEFEEMFAHKIKVFQGASVEWAQFIVNNRCGLEYVAKTKAGAHNLDGKYEVVRGLVADGNIVDFAQSCLEEMAVVVEDDIGLIYSDRYPEQISFHSKESCSLLKNGRPEKIKGGEYYETY